MQITDYDLNSYSDKFSIEVNNSQWGEVTIFDFFLFLTETRGWLMDQTDKENPFLVLPTVKNKCVVYTFHSFCKTSPASLKNHLQDYVDAYGDEIQFSEPETDDYDDSVEEAYRDFRSSQSI